MPAKASVNKHTQFHARRPAKIQQRIQGSSDRAAGPEDIVDQNDRFVFDTEIDIRFVGDMNGAADIIPVKSDIEFAVLDLIFVIPVNLVSYRK